MLDQVTKVIVIEGVLDSVIRSQVDIDDMQFGFMPGWGTTDAIFILHQLQKKHLGKHKPMYVALLDLEKIFDVYLGRFYGRLWEELKLRNG